MASLSTNSRPYRFRLESPKPQEISIAKVTKLGNAKITENNNNIQIIDNK